MLGILNFKSRNGFSLIESCIVLAVMGLIMSSVLPLSVRYYKATNWRKTDDNLQESHDALIAYFKQHRALPFASDESSGHSIYGKKIGCVPYQTLGIHKSMACDGFGRPLRYAVHAGVVNSDQAKASDKGALLAQSVVQSMRGPTIDYGNASVYEVPIAFVLVGGDNHSKDEKQNMADNYNFIDRPFSTLADNPFQQKLKWLSYGVLAFKTGMEIAREDYTHHKGQSPPGAASPVAGDPCATEKPTDAVPTAPSAVQHFPDQLPGPSQVPLTKEKSWTY